MRRNRLLLGTVLSVLLLVYPIISAKAAASMWGQTYDAFYNDVACSLVATSDGGYALAGSSGFFDVSDSDCWLVKTDTDGNMEWNKTYGASLDGDWAYSLIVTSDGGYALAGVQNCSASPLELHYWHYFYNDLGGDCWLVKTDANGNMEWNNTYGGTGDDWALSLINASDGGYVLAGYTSSFGAGGRDAWLVKTDATGTMEWNQTYGGTGNDMAFSLVATSDGGYALAGTWRSDASDFDFWLVKTDEFGSMEWNKTYGGTNDDVAFSLVATSDGGYALAGYATFLGEGSEDVWLVKTDANGNMEWNNTYGGGHPWWNDEAYSLVETSDGGYALAGSTQSPGTGSVNCWLLKTDGYGNIMWNHTYGGDLVDLAYSLIATSDGGYAAAGAWCIRMLESGHFDFLLIKTDENGVAPVAPEAAWVVLPFLLAATVSLFISKKKLLHSRVKEK